jgi:prophage DNA circulation protein
VTAIYQPSSADDAASIKDSVAQLFDAEIETAGDNGDDVSYEALRTCRAAIILDLDTRGAALPQLRNVVSTTPQPSLVLAQRLYQDAGRSDELITEADPVHPLFMPTSFMALVK